MDFAVIVPDRGDRKPFFEFCQYQISRFSLKPTKVYYINHEPVSDEVDLIPRVAKGIQQAKEDGIDLVFIIENDDYYDPHYFYSMSRYFHDYQFFGQNYTYYYNIKTLTYSKFEHAYRSSLFTTGFKISALNNFNFNTLKSQLFLDIELWKYARYKKRIFIDTNAIGIKHGMGKCAGKGHSMKLRYNDADMEWLESKVDDEALYFYRKMNSIL